jgi:hypothetical protein
MYAKQVASFTLVSCLAHFSCRYKPDDRTIHSHRSENLKFSERFFNLMYSYINTVAVWPTVANAASPQNKTPQGFVLVCSLEYVLKVASVLLFTHVSTLPCAGAHTSQRPHRKEVEKCET